MVKVVLRYVVRGIALLACVSFIAMFLVSLMPGDPARTIAGDTATPEVVRTIRDQLHLDQGLLARWWSFVGDFFQGHLQSISVLPGQSAFDLIFPAMWVTLSLMLLSFLIVLPVALLVGYLAATHRGSLLDRGLTFVSSVVLATPSFVLGLFLVAYLAIRLGWFPATGYVKPSDNFWDWILHLILPALTLAAIPAAEMARQVRSSLIDTLDQDYIRTAAAKGLPRRTIVSKHAAKNALVPVVVVLGLQVARIIGAAIVVEQIFALGGIGDLSVRAVLNRDIPLLQAIVLVAAVIVLVSNVLVDATNAYLDPRSRG